METKHSVMLDIFSQIGDEPISLQNLRQELSVYQECYVSLINTARSQRLYDQKLAKKQASQSNAYCSEKRHYLRSLSSTMVIMLFVLVWGICFLKTWYSLSSYATPFVVIYMVGILLIAEHYYNDYLDLRSLRRGEQNRIFHEMQLYPVYRYLDSVYFPYNDHLVMQLPEKLKDVRCEFLHFLQEEGLSATPPHKFSSKRRQKKLKKIQKRISREDRTPGNHLLPKKILLKKAKEELEKKEHLLDQKIAYWHYKVNTKLLDLSFRYGIPCEMIYP